MSADKKAFDQLELLGVTTDTFFSPHRAEQGAYTAQLKALKSNRNANARQQVMPGDELIDDQLRTSNCCRPLKQTPTSFASVLKNGCH